MNKVLCITGMHRSGTSLTASWIQQCGLQIHDGKLMGAGVGNKLGHFEDVDFVNLHSKYALKLWPDSKSWIVHHQGEIDRQTRQAFLDEASKLVEARNKKHEFWGWKDPRTVIFLDIWKELIPDMKCLFVWREARDVVDSLIRRSRKSKHPVDKIGTYRSVLVWQYYNEQILSYYERHADDTIVVNIRDIIQNDQVVIRSIVEKLGLNLKHSSISSLVREDMLRYALSEVYRDFVMNILRVGKIEAALGQVSLPR